MANFEFAADIEMLLRRLTKLLLVLAVLLMQGERMAHAAFAPSSAGQICFAVANQHPDDPQSGRAHNSAHDFCLRCDLTTIDPSSIAQQDMVVYRALEQRPTIFEDAFFAFHLERLRPPPRAPPAKA